MSEKLVVIYNKWLKTAGGGERSTLDHAFAFASYGATVNIVTDLNEAVDLDYLFSQFGFKKNPKIKLTKFNDRTELEKYLENTKIDIFCNHCFGDVMKNYGDIGVYVVMFPLFQDTLQTKQNLETYDLFFCISDFTRLYTEMFLECGTKAKTLMPPISDSHLQLKEPTIDDKEKIILNVGRFNTLGHNKGQLNAIRAFIKLNHEKVLDESWKLVLCGQFNDVDDTKKYLELCKKVAKNYNIKININVPFEELYSYYQKATCLWQFTGYGKNFGDFPEKCEHLGLVALDALAHGTIPMIFARSGASFVFDIGNDGFIFLNYKELKMEMELLKNSYGTLFHQKLIGNCYQKSKALSYISFEQKMHKILREL